MEILNVEDLNIELERLSDVFFMPSKPLISQRADRLQFEFDSSKSGQRMRDVTLRAVTVSDDAEILFTCLCHESDRTKTFRFTRIASDIQCGGKSYDPSDFLCDYLGISETQCQEALKAARAYTYITNNFDSILGERLADVSPVWSGAVETEFKLRGSNRLLSHLTLKSVYLLGDDDYYLWGYSASMGKILFIPYALIEGKITTEDGKSYSREKFLEALGVGAQDFPALLAENLKDAAPVWSGNVPITFKSGGADMRLTLKSVLKHEGGDECVLWGYEESLRDFVFLPFSLIDGNITAGGKGFQRKTFLSGFLGLNSDAP